MSECDLDNPKNQEAIARDWAASAIGKKKEEVLAAFVIHLLVPDDDSRVSKHAAFYKGIQDSVLLKTVFIICLIA